MILRLAHLPVPAPLSPDDVVAMWRALAFFLLTLAAMLVGHWLDERSERREGESRAKDVRQRLRDFQATQHKPRRG